MWIKQYKDGTRLTENRNNGTTWLTTPINNIKSIQLECEGNKSTILLNYDEYWHSRGAVMSQDGAKTDILERIQGRIMNEWYTITWDGHKFLTTIENHAFGKPIKEHINAS